MRRGTKPSKAKVESERPAASKSRKSENASVRDLEERLAQSLEREKATGEILRTISQASIDLQAVLESVAESAARLCGATEAIILRVEHGRLRLAASYGLMPTTWQPDVALPITRGMPSGRAVLDRVTVHVKDLLAAPDTEFAEAKARARLRGTEQFIRTVLAAPLVRNETSIGVIVVRRAHVQAFSDKQISLLKTFADQAVIAIENVRLFKELEARNRELTETLEQQTATSEILRVISNSPTDIQPVFEAVAESAARLCETNDVAIFRRDGDLLRLVAHHGAIPEDSIGEFTIPLVRGTASGRAVLDGCTVHIADMQAQAKEFPEGSAFARQLGQRAVLSVPLMRDNVAIGTIALRRTEANLFSDRQVGLLKTFADQAVIAIENVRLFTELQEKNRALTQAHGQVTEALEQQTATSEILRVISSSPTDVQPVFDAIVRSAVRLCDALFGTLATFDGELLHLVATYNWRPAALDIASRMSSMSPSRVSISGRVVLERDVVHVPDVELDEEFGRDIGRAVGFRGALGVPMLRDGVLLGVIGVGRAESGPFSEPQIELLKTFADQAVIAIENVRLFTELQARTQDL